MRVRVVLLNLLKVNKKTGAEGTAHPTARRWPPRTCEFSDWVQFRGVGPKRLAWVLEGNFSPSSLASTIRQGESELGRKFGISGTVVSALIRLSEVKLMELEELQLPDTMAIELNVTHGEREAVFRSIDELSTGQQCCCFALIAVR
ncbi:hypothetical protein I3679_000840 [Proteus mirabilis]|uniref:Uncharacterized protein n=1 Tax=Proteus mirabilis TaxID=584 RepID=A0ABD5LQ60_PROMI